MRRIQLFEIQDQVSFPRFLRDAVTDTLRMMFSIGRVYKCAVPRIVDALSRSRATRVLDLCSGGGGAWMGLQETFDAEAGRSPEVCLTDKYPNAVAFENARLDSRDKISFLPQPVDVTDIPNDLDGFRTIFTAFHHFPPAQARAILQDAAANGRGIGIFETPGRSFFTLVFAMLVPFMAIGLAPFTRPFSWSRLFWTYIIPVIPFVLWFDGIISCLRAYSPRELREMIATLHAPDYRWEVGVDSTGFLPVPVTYLIGYPLSENSVAADFAPVAAPGFAAAAELQPANAVPASLGARMPVHSFLGAPALREITDEA